MTAAQSAEPAMSGYPRVVVTVGTDHHPFDRIVSWINQWLAAHPDRVGACFVQRGTATVRPVCAESAFLGVGELTALLDAADVIVCHGGPASLAEAWSRDRMPIVIPRLARLGEHVDDHQADFCAKVAESGTIALARSLSGFTRLLDQAVQDPSRFRTSGAGSGVPAAVSRLGELVEELVRRQPRPKIGRGRLLRPGGGQSPQIMQANGANRCPARGPAPAGPAATIDEEQE
jgi:UDP-N-acetylglucosamine transferase subunit ALG13